MKIRRYNFNLIEIVLTVAVISFGVVVILGMLPKGLQITRNAGMESYASEVIDQMSSYLQQMGASSITVSRTQNNEKAFLNASFDDEAIMKEYAELLDGNNLSNSFSKTGYKRTNVVGVYRKEDGTGAAEKSIYVIVMGNSDTIDGVQERRIDFSGMIRAWKRPRTFNMIRIKHKNVGVVEDKLPDDHDCVDLKCDEEGFEKSSDYDAVGATVCMELSYPLSLPYAERYKKYYVFEVGR